jgi:hypothetical protein
MIRHPRVGQRVQVHYAKHYAALMPHHGRIGTVRIVARGPGPRNHRIEFDDGTVAAIPAGNLRVASPPKESHG